MNIGVIRRQIAAGQYQLTQHAKDEAANDEMDTVDVESIVLTGRLVRT